MLGVLIVALLTGCKGTQSTEKNDKPDRIVLIEYSMINNGIGIINVDGHQYLAGLHGGFLHLESCKCKSNNQ
jgi:hypothetical protein